MTPDPSKVLPALAGALGQQVVPEVRTPFAGQTVGLSATLLMILAQDYDRHPAMLAEENLAVRDLLRAGAPLIADEGLRVKLADLDARQPNSDLRISGLTNENSELRRALIDVHAAVEAIDSPQARALDERIWAEMARSTKRRHVEGLLG